MNKVSIRDDILTNITYKIKKIDRMSVKNIAILDIQITIICEYSLHPKLRISCLSK